LLRGPLTGRLSGRVPQPLQQLLGQRLSLLLDALEVGEEGLVERVEVGLGVDAERARHVVEALEGAVVQSRLERAGERERLLRPHRDHAPPQLVEEPNEHLVLLPPRSGRCAARSSPCAAQPPRSAARRPPRSASAARSSGVPSRFGLGHLAGLTTPRSKHWLILAPAALRPPRQTPRGPAPS